MNRRLVTILFTAFVIAALGTYVVYRLVGNSLSAVHQGTTTKVVAAAVDIKLGTVLKPADLKWIEIASGVPKGAILKPELAVGRGVLSNLYEGEPILDNRLASVGSG